LHDQGEPTLEIYISYSKYGGWPDHHGHWSNKTFRFAEINVQRNFLCFFRCE